MLTPASPCTLGSAWTAFLEGCPPGQWQLEACSVALCSLYHGNECHRDASALCSEELWGEVSPDWYPLTLHSTEVTLRVRARQPVAERQTRHKPGSDQALPWPVSRLQEAVHPSQPVAISPTGCPHSNSLQLSSHSASSILVSHDLKFYLIDRKHFRIIFLTYQTHLGH